MSVSAHSLSKLSKIPPLLYGTAWKGEATTSLVLQAFASGFRGIDTAAQRKHYREDLVGVAVEQAESELGIARELLWLQTK
jgi:diketogulonate reductase-like aldo/keto reductase